MKGFKLQLIDQGIHIQGIVPDLNGKEYTASLLISYNQVSKPWKAGNEWASKQWDGATAGTRAQWTTIQEHRDEINEALRAAGKTEIPYYPWTSEEVNGEPGRAWVVVSYGNVAWYGKYGSNDVRAVSAFRL